MRITLLFLFGLLVPHSLYADTVIKEIVDINLPNAAVLEAAGDFCNISWHPLIADTVCYDGDTVRNVILVGGAGVVERLINEAGDKKYTYEIIKQCVSFEVDGSCNGGPVLPIANYKASYKIVPVDESSSIIMWQGNFDSLTSDAGAFIASFYRSGLDSLKANLEID